MIRFFEQFDESRLIAAHRGFRSCYPENTRCAFEASLGRSHFIELDVRLSRDGTPVIVHDSTLQRTSDAKDRVDLMDIDQLRSLDMGSWFLEADPFGTLAAGVMSRSDLKKLMPQRIMTLIELLSWAGENTTFINIEIKDQQKSQLNHMVVPRILEDIQESGTHQQALISSFNHDYLRQCKNLFPELAVAALIEHHYPSDLLKSLHDLDAEACHVDNASITPGRIAELKSAGFIVNVYTVNDTNRQDQLFDAGATALFSDFLRQAT